MVLTGRAGYVISRRRPGVLFSASLPMNTEAPATKKRHWWLAALLSVLWPGLGQLYNTQYRRAGAMMGSFTACAVLLLFFASRPPTNLATIGLVVLFLLVSIVVMVGIVVDAAIGARRVGRASLGRLNRWYVYAAFIAAGSLLNEAGDSIPKQFLKSTS